MKGIIVYHKKDLDGLASGAILSTMFPDYDLFGYHYGEPFDIRKCKNKEVIIADVSFEPERMFSLLNTAAKVIFIDHHKSAYDGMMKYAEENNVVVSTSKFNGLIDEIDFDGIAMRYFYSERLSACEMCLAIYPVGTALMKEKVRLLGQYDTWRQNDDKKFIFDSKWEDVMNFQYGMRQYNDVVSVKFSLHEPNSIEEISKIGNAILKYQEVLNAGNVANNAFELDFCGLRVIACNGVPFNSNSFKTVYHEDIHDAMMPFQFDGKNNRWNFSLYTTKQDVDILSVAKNFGGGGHQQACGFSIDAKEISINSEEFHTMNIVFDTASLPKDFNVEEFIKQMKRVPLTFVPCQEK